MFTYVGLIKLTPEGRENLKEAPQYLDKIKHFVEAEGGEIDTIFAMMGPWDFFAVVKYPTIEAASRALAQIGTLEVVKTETFPVDPQWKVRVARADQDRDRRVWSGVGGDQRQSNRVRLPYEAEPCERERDDPD